MGLKTTNYTVTSLGITLPQAYAAITNLSIDGDVCRAAFAIQTTREAVFSLKPVAVKHISFKYDRSRSLMTQAYENAVSSYETDVPDGSLDENGDIVFTGGTGVIKKPFYGWQADIVGAPEVEPVASTEAVLVEPAEPEEPEVEEPKVEEENEPVEESEETPLEELASSSEEEPEPDEPEEDIGEFEEVVEENPAPAPEMR